MSSAIAGKSEFNFIEHNSNLFFQVLVRYFSAIKTRLDKGQSIQDFFKNSSPLFSFKEIGDLLMFVTHSGNASVIKNMANFCLNLIELGLVMGEDPCRAQVFALQFADKIYGEKSKLVGRSFKWPSDPIEEKLFLELSESWSSEDQNLISDLFRRLLNRHTYQAHNNKKANTLDFSDFLTEQFPVEYFFLSRIREQVGLKSVELEHQLLPPPFDLLPPARNYLSIGDREAELFDLMIDVFPDFYDVLDLFKTRAWDLQGIMQQSRGQRP